MPAEDRAFQLGIMAHPVPMLSLGKQSQTHDVLTVVERAANVLLPAQSLMWA